MYHNRNRAYIPQLGRFLQQDPNQSAMSLIAASPFHGRGAGAVAVAFSLDGLYGDGANLYQYLGSNPWMRNDPTGLSWDPFSIVDDYLAESVGNVAAFLGAIGHGSKAAGIIGAKLLSWLPIPGANAAGELGLVALGEQTMEQAMFNMAMGAGIGGAGKLLGKLAVLTARIGANAFRYAAHYAANSGIARAAFNALPVGFLAKGAKWALRKAAKLIGVGRCGCFASGTVVWTAMGQVPIEDVRVGDWVYARDAEGQIVLRMVTDEIVTEDAAQLFLTIEHEGGRLETLATTDEHPFWVEQKRNFVRADELVPGDVLKAATGESIVRGLSISADRTTVYNLTVDGVHTYLVGPDGVWVHNACNIMPGNIFTKGYNIAGRAVRLTTSPLKLVRGGRAGRYDGVTLYAEDGTNAAAHQLGREGLNMIKRDLQNEVRESGLESITLIFARDRAGSTVSPNPDALRIWVINAVD